MKKFAAISLSAVLFLQPMAASAVTWGNIVNGLRNSGTNRYTEDGTTIEKDGENYTITGGTLTSDVDYSFLEETGDKTNILLKSLTVDGYVYITADDGKQMCIRDRYYAHPRNAFWPILFDIFGEAPSRDYRCV